ncbi:MAG: 3'(2'),5'-bisphosphate nucleotidase CysQ [Candidatus Uhrbacteria bacterium]|nr:3'(2'),5'-bisphosphate nucleotidase CysQ [Candidatus Uhrbacteria bacterium]
MLIDELGKYLSIAKEAAEVASDSIMDVYLSSNFGVEIKDDNSPITIADRRSHEIIFDILSRTGLPVLSEEGDSVSYNERKEWKDFWLVDPIDGTKEFIARTGDFTVNIALIESGISILGVVLVPAHGLLYYAVSGGGAFLEVGEKTEMIHVSEKPNGNVRIVASRNHMNEETVKYMEEYISPEIKQFGSTRKFLAVAEGAADVYPRLGTTMEWDTAAAQIIVEEAGGSVLTVEGLERMRYNKEDLRNPHFIVSN